MCLCGWLIKYGFDWVNLFLGVTFVTVATGILFAVRVVGLSFSCVGLLLFWFIGAVTPELSEWSTMDMVLVHSLVDWITQRMALDYTT